MIEIKDLLKKFNSLLLNKEVQISLIQEVLLEVLNIKIEKDKIKIINNDVYLNIKPIYKNEIFLNKEKIDNLIFLKSSSNKKLKIY